MKALLVALNAKYIHTNLAVYSLKKYASKYEEHVELAEYTINNQMDMIVHDIYERKPDVLLFSCYVWNIESVKDVAETICKVLPHTDIWMGGPEVSYEQEAFFEKLPWIKGIMLGEGEETFLRLMEYYYEKKGSLNEINGICFREEGEIMTGMPGELPDMDDLPFVYDNLEPFDNKILYYESSRGCPFRCSYCMSSIDKTVRFRSMERVKRELSFFLEKEVRQVKFIDRTFNIRKERTMEILEFLKEHDNGITNFHFEVAGDLITREEIELLNQLRPGYVQMEIGVQTTNEETLAEIDRKMDFNRITEVVEQLKKPNNIHLHLDLIAGLPKENLTSFIHSFNEVYRLKPHELQLGFLKVLKGSKMHQNALEYGLIYGDKAPYEVLETKWISFEEIIRLKGVEEMLEVYYNSGLFPHTIAYLESFFSGAFELYDSLADYYKKHHLLEQKHTRITRYEILLHFMEEIDGIALDEAKQILLLDLYLRENLKTRPEFAGENEKYKEATQKFYREYSVLMKGKNFHVEPFGIDVLQLMKDGRICRKKCMILFDYEKRHAVSRMAEVKECVWE